MKKWHMEGILRIERMGGGKLQIPRPGQRTLWSGFTDQRPETEFFLVKMMRAMRERVQRQA
jgi:hypothetical protein